MSSPSVKSILSFSWNKTKALLLPFNLKRWLKILFIVWLAGYSGGGGSIPNIPDRPNTQQTQAEDQAVNQTLDAESAEQLAEDAAQTAPATTTADAAPASAPSAALILLFVILVLVLALFFSWLSARFNFVFLDLLTQGDVRIGESFSRHKELGNSYFLFSLAYIFCLTIIGLIIAGLGFALKDVLFGNPLGILFSILFFIAFLIVIVVIGMIISDFVIPMMYADKARAMPTIKNFLASHPKGSDIAIFFFTKMGVGILTGIAGATVAFIVIIVGLLVFGLIGLILFLIGALLVGIMPFLKVPLIVIGVLLLIPTILLLTILIMGAVLPIPIFFRYFSLSYLNRLIPRYNLLGFSSSQS